LIAVLQYGNGLFFFLYILIFEFFSRLVDGGIVMCECSLLLCISAIFRLIMAVLTL